MDAKENSVNKNTNEIKYSQPQELTLKAINPKDNKSHTAMLKIIGIANLKTGQYQVSTSASSLKDSSKMIYMLNSSAKNLNILNEEENICVNINSLPDSLQLDATPSLGNVFPDGYPYWYVNGGELGDEKGKKSIQINLKNLFETNNEVTITVKCSEKSVNYESVIADDGNVTTNGNERFASHSISFSKNTISMITPAGIYNDPMSDDSTEDGLKYKLVDEDGKILEKNVTIPTANEFVFDKDDDGRLTISFEAKVVGGQQFRKELQSGAFYFVPDEFENYNKSNIVWENGKGGSDETPADYDFATGIISATVKYTAMPKKNAAFGYKTVKLMYKPKTGEPVEVTKSNYEVFFKKDGKNHPACTTCANCPNWFYYWKEGAVCTLLDSAKFDSSLPDTIMGEYTNGSGIIRLGKNAASNYVEKITLNWNGNTAIVDADSKGSELRAVAIWAKHELTHELIYLEQKKSSEASQVDLKDNFYTPCIQAKDVYDAAVNTYNHSPTPENLAAMNAAKGRYEVAKEVYETELEKYKNGTRHDTDKDMVPNALEITGNGINEISVKSDPEVADTYGLVSKFTENGMNNPKKIEEYMDDFRTPYPDDSEEELRARAIAKLRNEINAIYSGYNTYADNELRARVRSGKIHRGKDYFSEKDWAYPGTNQN